MNKFLSCAVLFLFVVAPLEAVEVRSVSTIGTVCPQHKSTLGSVVSGRVETVLVDVGDSVKKGEALIKLDTSFFAIALSEAKDSVLAARVDRIDAGRNFARMKKLFHKPQGQAPSISQKRFEDAQIHYEQAVVFERQALENLKRAETNLKEATICAPYDGVITKRFVHPGEAVTAAPATKLLEMMSQEKLYVEFSAPQAQMQKLQVGTRVFLDIEGSGNRQHEAKIDLIFPDIDEKTRSIKCRALLPNTDQIFHPGSLVRVTIPLGEVERVPS